MISILNYSSKYSSSLDIKSIRMHGYTQTKSENTHSNWLLSKDYKLYPVKILNHSEAHLPLTEEEIDTIFRWKEHKNPIYSLNY